ncbi:peptidoglycan-binding protein [Brevibacterium litoralis]|uniref:peptidoglycan-binding protein n=1 Tax=Brevibacterium litoralis TaxID=3138935 RepID=UPI0032ED9063
MNPNPVYPTFSRGDSSDVLPAVKAQLARLGLQVGDPGSEEFDEQFTAAIRHFQQERGLLCNGILGPETFAQIELARHRLGDRVLRYDPVRAMVGDDVAQLQKLLSGLGIYTRRIDYEFGTHTDAAVREAQKGIGVNPDGIAGPTTLRGLQAVSRGNEDGNLFALQEKARVTASGPSLVGRVFVIEAGTSAQDFPNAPYTDELRALEADFSGDIARRVEGRLAALGASPILLTGSHGQPRLGDELGASAVITINQDASESPRANGLSTYHFGFAGDRRINSPMGEQLAELVQREILSRTGFLDCRTHSRTWHSLRVLRAPKVHVLAGYLTNDRDRALLSDPAVRDGIAYGIAVSLQRLYFTEEQDPPTGTLDLAALRSS